MILDLDQLLNEATEQQARKRSRRQLQKQHSSQDKNAQDYADRLAEKALYRRLINDSDIAQDGIRFVWFFSSPNHHEGRSLGDWRRRIDREIEDARNRSAVRDRLWDTYPGDKASDDEQPVEETELSDEE